MGPRKNGGTLGPTLILVMGDVRTVLGQGLWYSFYQQGGIHLLRHCQGALSVLTQKVLESKGNGHYVILNSDFILGCINGMAFRS